MLFVIDGPQSAASYTSSYSLTLRVLYSVGSTVRESINNAVMQNRDSARRVHVQCIFSLWLNKRAPRGKVEVYFGDSPATYTFIIKTGLTSLDYCSKNTHD